MGIGDRIRYRRMELNMSQDELAKRVGYKSRSSIQKIESARNLPITKIALMATALDCSPSYLMGWESELPKAATGHSPATSVIVEPDYDPEYIKNATDIYNQIMSAPPEIQAAISTLLKSQRHDS